MTPEQRIRALEIENDELREQVIQLEELNFTPDRLVPIELGLTVKEACIFRALLARDICTKEYLHNAVISAAKADDPSEIKIVDVFICKLRKKIKPFGLAVLTHWGEGYSIPAATREKIKNWEHAA